MELRRDEFERWLRSKKPQEAVGIPNAPYRCPLAHFLRHQGALGPSVYSETFYTDGKGYETPAWAGEFLDTVDDLPRRVRSITARRALAILATLPAEESAHAA